MNKMDEMILVVPRDEVFPDGRAFQGFDSKRVDEVLLAVAVHGRLMRRGDAEEDATYKQPIPYVVIARPAEDGALEVFAYERLGGGGETRLHGRVSVGVGGHVNVVSDGPDMLPALLAEAGREIEEEVDILGGCSPHIRVAGLINDDSDAVGEVHLGLLMVALLPAGTDVHVRETEQLLGRFVRLDSLAETERLENWSVVAVQALARPEVLRRLAGPATSTEVAAAVFLYGHEEFGRATDRERVAFFNLADGERARYVARARELLAWLNKHG
jgi:predicted NUDIX family phosphoesterase